VRVSTGFCLKCSPLIFLNLNSLTETTTEHAILPPRSNPCALCIHYSLNLVIYPNSDARALVRLQSDHINRTLVPKFYRYLQAQETSAQIEGGKEFLESIQGLVSLFERAEKENEDIAVGLWKEGGKLGWADVMAGPCACAIFYSLL
jgi:glutathione S-transferase